MREVEPVQIEEAKAGAAAIPVLLYHSVSDSPTGTIAPYTVSPAMFERQLDLIADRRHALTATQFAQCLRGNAVLPANPVVITFDDGFADNLEVAARLLADRDLVATVYVTTGYVGRPSMLAREQLRELEAMKVEIGAHAHTHTPLDELDLAVAVEEISGSKQMLEHHLNHPVESFAYPHGYSSHRVRLAVRSVGFSSACGVRNAFSHGSDDPWNIARLTVRSDFGLERISQWVNGQGAPVARRGEALQTRGWRVVRKIRSAGLQRPGSR
jgi:peptidoglycan/xylan/chitin deacetylase (PgdA/CDA1 family)